MKYRWLGAVLAGIMMVAASGCSTVTLTRQDERKLSSRPTFQERQHFFLWGLVGDKWIDAKDVCGTSTAQQMQTQFTFVDGLLGLITLGIYSPRSAKIWCQ